MVSDCILLLINSFLAARGFGVLGGAQGGCQRIFQFLADARHLSLLRPGKLTRW